MTDAVADDGQAADRRRSATRFRPPRMLFPAIERPFLLTRLAEGLARQIVFLKAPAGFGKTALMKAAFERIGSGLLAPPAFGAERPSCGWLSLGPGHNDPAALVADLAAALGLPAAAGTSAELLLDALEQAGGMRLVFLDAVDMLTGTEASSVLARLMLEAPENLRIAASARRRPPLPLARLSVQGLLVEIAAVELAFTRTETRRLLARAVGQAETDSFAEAAGGWPAVVQLAAGRLPSLDAAARKGLVAGDDPVLHAFVEETVLSGLPPALRLCLRRAAIMERFPLDLAQALSPEGPLTSDDAGVLADIAPLAERNASGWWRLNPVLRAALSAALSLEIGQETKQLHSTAAHWLAERGFIEMAVSHAARGGDFELAAETIRRAGGVNLFIRAGHTVLEHLIDDLPADIIHDSPELTLCHVLVLAKRGAVTAARERLDMLRQRYESEGGSGIDIDRPTLDHIDGLLDIYNDRPIGAAELASMERHALRLDPHSTWELGWLYNHLCVAHTRFGDLERARENALKALASYREEKTAYAQIFMLIHLGLVASLAGNFSASLQFCREAENLIQSEQWSDRSLAAICRLIMAEGLYAQGDVAQVEQIVVGAVVPLTRGEGWVELFTRLFTLLARARMRTAGIDTAMSAADKAEEVAVERALPRLKVACDILRIELFTRAGMIETAAEIAGRLSAARLLALREGDAGRVSWTWREHGDFLLARARLAMAQGRPAEALAELEAVIAAAVSAGHGSHRLVGEILAARAAWTSGAQRQALAYLQSAIALARAHEATQLFIDEGQEFAITLRAIVRRFGLKAFSVDAVDFMSRIVGHGFGRPSQAAARQPDEAGRTAAGLLSGREATVLKLLAEGRSNKEMARALNLSEATIKFHLKNIYAKLGVSRRAMAVSVGRRLNLTAGG